MREIKLYILKLQLAVTVTGAVKQCRKTQRVLPQW